MATQNPIEYEGTYPLPEAQLDRFLLKIKMGYPSLQEEVEVLRRAEKSEPIQNISSVISTEQLLELQQIVKSVYVEDNVKAYIVELARATREHVKVYLGVSPRASIALMKASQAYALMRGRDFVKPDDVQYLAPFVFSHRLIIQPEARYEGVTEEQIIKSIVRNIDVPVKRFAEQ